jgi:hypothetical protein
VHTRLGAHQRDVGQTVHGANAMANARSRPVARIVAVSNVPPAWDTTPLPAPSTQSVE